MDFNKAPLVVKPLGLGGLASWTDPSEAIQMTPTRRTARLAPLTLASLLIMAQLGALLIAAPIAGAAPAVTTISPNTGNNNGDVGNDGTPPTGEAVVITGTGFSSPTVKFGGVAGVVSASTATTITVAPPARSAAGSVDVVVTNSDGSVTTVTNGYTYTLASAPTITSIQTNSGPTNGGTSFEITGTNFHTGATKPTVNFGTTAGIITAAVTATTITVTTPVHAPGAVTLSVVNPGGQSAEVTNGFTFVVAAAPTITAVSPNSGGSNGGTIITITGTNFVSAATVLVGGVAAVMCTALDAPTVGCAAPTSTALKAVTPARSSGTVDVVVSNADGQIATQANSFIFTAANAPTLASSPVSPSSGPSVGGTKITITGTNFVDGATVTLGGTAAKVSFVSGTILNAVVPLGSGAVTLVVANPDGQSVSKTAAFTYQTPLLVTSVSPVSGTANGGTALTISGQGFVTGAKVSFDDGTTFLAASGNGNSLSIPSSPGHAAGTADVIVRNPDGKTARLDNGFVYTAANAPTVTAVSPTSGSENGGTSLAITGTNFHVGEGKPTVSVGGTSVSASLVTVTSATSITVIVPAHAVGVDVPVIVTNPDGTASADTIADDFDYVVTAAPAVTSLSPTSGTENGGTTLTITGTGFHTGTNAKPTVTIDGVTVPATSITVSSATQIVVVTVPNDAATHGEADVPVIVTNPDGDASPNTAADDFDYTAADSPTVTSLDVTTGPTNGRTTVTVTGTNFVAGATVKFGANSAVVSSVASTTIVLTTPSAAVAAAVAVMVTNPGGDSGSLAAPAFTYVAGSSPTVTSVNPASGINTAIPAIVTITGTNFALTTAVTFNGAGATECTAVDTPTVGCTAPTATQVAVVPPAAAAGAPIAVAVENHDGLSGSLASAYRYLPSPPTLAATPLATTSGPTNGGTSVAISGGAFDTTNKNTVLFGTVPSTDVTVDSAIAITVISPAKAFGASTVSVLDSNGQSATIRDDSNTGGKEDFTFVAALPPTITTLNIPAGPANGGTRLVITGTNFHGGSNAKPTVTFGGSFGSNVVVSNIVDGVGTTITVTVPGHAAGATNVVVTNPDGQTGTKTNGYTFVGAGGPPSPTVTSVAPTTGPAAGGTAVTITGTNFATGATANFGSTACTSLVVVSATSITCTTPAGTGAVTVAVTVSSQTGTLASAFTYDAATSASSSASNSASSSASSSSSATTSSSTTTTTPPVNGEPTAREIEDANEDVDVDVKRVDGDNIVSFDLPTLPGTPQGVQVWRSNSPFALIATLDDSDPDFADGDYLDQDAPADSKYLVTVYYGLTAALGYSANGNSADVPGFDNLGSGSSIANGGVPMWVWILVVLLILAVIAVVLIIVLRRRNAAEPKPAEEGYAWDDEPAAAGAAASTAAAEPAARGASKTHTCRCPACGTQFSVTGVKPIQTSCPGCGKQGLLR